nr:unnamed protein product [Callosobruchus analis]
MKILFTLLFIAFAYANEEEHVFHHYALKSELYFAVEVPRKLDPSFLDKITAEIEKSRQKFPDPFVIKELSYEIPANQLGRIFSGKVGIKNLVLKDVKSFKFKAGIFPPLITFNLPHAKLDVDYSLDLCAFDVDTLKVDGAGHVSLEISGVDLAVKVNPTIFQGPKESIKKIDLNLKSAKFSITGLLGDEALSSAVTKWVNANIMSIFKKEIGTVLTLVKNFLNAVLPSYIAVMDKRG